MKVTICANTAWNILNFRRALVDAFVTAGYDVTVLAPRDQSVEALEALGCKFQHITIDPHGLNAIRDYQFMRTYRRFLLNQGDGYALNFTIKPVIYGALAARGTHVRPIGTLTGLGTAFIRGGLLTRVSEELFRFSQRSVEALVFHNPDDRSYFLNRRLVAPDKAHLSAGSGIDVEAFSPTPFPEEPLTFLMISRMLKYKGAGEFIEAAVTLKKQSANVRCLLLGGVDKNNPNTIDEGIYKAAIADGAIEHIEPVADVRPIISKAHVVVLPSYREGAPRGLIEAAAMGRSLIATDVPGCREVVVPEENGYLVPKEDAWALSQAMLRIANLSPNELSALGRKSRELVEAKFDVRKVVKTYLQLIDPAAER